MLQALANGEHDATCDLPDLVSYVLRDCTAAIPAASADLVRKIAPDGGAGGFSQNRGDSPSWD